jgi:hypothetical protein
MPALLVALIFLGGSLPQAEAADAKKSAPTQSAPQAKAPAAAPSPAAAPAQQSAGVMPKMPDEYKLNLLIRTTIIAINQANKTGNYTVLRDLAAPDFQKINSPEKLAQIFSELRKSNFDLSPILFFEPKLIRAPGLLSNGMLRVTGFFDTHPQRVTFDLIYQQLTGDWRLFAVSVGTRAAPPLRLLPCRRRLRPRRPLPRIKIFVRVRDEQRSL